MALHQHASRIYDVVGVIWPFLFAPGAEVLAIDPAVDRVGGLFPGEHGRYHHVGTGHAISSGEHTGQFGLERERIGTERSRFCGHETQPLTEAIHIRDLPNCGNDSVARYDELGT